MRRPRNQACFLRAGNWPPLRGPVGIRRPSWNKNRLLLRKGPIANQPLRQLRRQSMVRHWRKLRQSRPSHVIRRPCQTRSRGILSPQPMGHPRRTRQCRRMDRRRRHARRFMGLYIPILPVGSTTEDGRPRPAKLPRRPRGHPQGINRHPKEKGIIS